jgi:predicted lipid-binding transport protein (Tim44 family)
MPDVPARPSLMHSVLIFVGLREPAPARIADRPQPAAEPIEAPVPESSLESGLRDIRRTDRGFDPSRIAGYLVMVFRQLQQAWMTGDIGPLRDRLTAEMHSEIQAHYERFRRSGHVNRVAEIEVAATVTEAWQEHGQDYLTAHIRGSMIDYTVNAARGTVVDGSREVPREVEEFWTFTRPAGLNFWMLSAIQT